MLERWKKKLAQINVSLALARRKAAYWRLRKKLTSPSTKAGKRARTMLGQREAEVAKLKKDAAYAERVVKRHETKHISQTGLDLIKEFEGFFSKPYDDGVGVQTIGYGTTSSDIKPLPKSVTKDEAERILKKTLEKKYEPAVRRADEDFKLKLKQHEFDALVSFVYNLGPAALDGGPNFQTIGKAIRSGDRSAIANAILLYDNPHTPNVHAGLKRRRQTERRLFLGGKP